MKISFSVRSFLVFLAVSFTAPAVVLFGFFEARSGVQHAREDAREMNRLAASLIQHDSVGLIQELRALTDGLAAGIDLEEMEFEDPKYVRRILESYPGSAMLLLDERARSVASYATDREIPVGIDYSDRDYIQQAIATRRPVVSGPLKSRTSREGVVVFSIPLIGGDGSLKGLLGGGIPIEQFRPGYELPRDQFALIVDTIGDVVSAVNAGHFENLAPEMAKLPIGDNRLDSAGIGAELHIAEVKPIGWKVIAGLPESYVAARTREAVYRAALVGLLCALIGAGIVSLLAFPAVRGVDGISQQIQRMSAANLQPIKLSEHAWYPHEARTLIGNFNDLLERTARMRLAEFEAISRVSDTILIADSNGRITYANKAGARLVGEVTGASLKEIIGEETASAILSHDQPREWKGDCPVRTSLGGSFDGFLSSSPILEDGKLTSVVVIVHDITREKARREASAQSEKMITLGELVAGTSHELNNPLAIVTGYADLLLEEDGLSPEQRSKIESVRKGALRASNIVHSLLAFARKRTPERVPTNVNSVIEAALQLKEYDIVTSGIRLERDLAVDLPPVLADPHQIQQVLLNVLNNAQDATVGTANVPAIAVKSEMGEGKVIIRIEDTGSGISKADLKKVFDPFFTTKPLGKGTGLGLSIAYGIVREHGGEIQIQSQAGRGTQVRIELPAEESGAAGSLGQSGEARKIFPKKFLVVDDEPEIVSIMQTAFTRNGSTVDSAASIEEALALATKNEYDFVITDVKMPRGSGIDLYKKLCAVKPSYRSRIVFLTGDTNNPSTMQFFEEEGVVYFSKPLDFQAMEKFVTSAESQAKPD